MATDKELTELHQRNDQAIEALQVEIRQRQEKISKIGHDDLAIVRELKRRGLICNQPNSL